MSRVNAGVTIRDPRAAEMSLQASTAPGSDVLFLTISWDHVWFSVGAEGDLEAEAAAMDRLAELATETAARLRSLATARTERSAA
ncbi:hypothetical protein [Streptosporangium jomthongense]|uniref:Uncharacterized protein n=1 Tax=Streptosporangium jomthongense TaxID=1193683 RepID=A0ABV8F1E0_9ACTN